MKRLLTGFAVTAAAVVWMMGSWFFFDSIAAGDQGSGTPAVAEVNRGGPQDTGAAEGKCGEHWEHRRRCCQGHHGLWKKLNLTDAQKKEIFSIRLEERAKMKPVIQKLKAGHDQMRALEKAGQFDEAKVQAVAKGQAEIISQLIAEKARMKSRMYAVLTSEQRARAEQMRESWKAGLGKGPRYKD
jgi:Spy/CpxP family protein refolding chaperone